MSETPRDDPKPLHVLLVEDDADLRPTITSYLENEGFTVSSAATRRDALEQAKRSDFAMVLLDLRLGTEDGIDVLRALKGKNDVPVIVVTGSRRAEIDRVVGLELGADDYIVKPFLLRELRARMSAVLRRFEAPRPQTQASKKTCRFAGWTFDRRNRRLTDPAGQAVPLTNGEFALLSSFVEAPQRTLTREFLLQATRVHEDICDRSIDVQILRLRRKLEDDSSAPSFIVTERGVGYRFAVVVDM